VGAIYASPFAAVAAVLLASTLAEAQQPQQAQVQADIDKLPVSLDRIRERLEHEPALSIDFFNTTGIPVFRTETRSDLVLRFDGEYWRLEDANTARPTVNKWHYDYEKMVNPNSKLGYGPDILPGIMAAIHGLKEWRNNAERDRVRQQINDELQQIEENRRRDPPPE
jgi:hypothetical protein